MKKSYRYAIAYFALMSALLLLSGIWLFAHKIGFTPDQMSAYYLGSAEAYTQPKSVHGLLEVALPHLGSMGLFIMVTGHFLIFTPSKYKPFAVGLLIAMFAAALMNIMSPFGIIAGFTLFVWLKLFSFALLQVLGIALLWLVFKTAFTGILGERKKNSKALEYATKTIKGTS